MFKHARKHIAAWSAAGLAALVLSVSGLAQDQAPGTGGSGPHGHAMMMQKELNLTADQQAQIKQIHEADRSKFEALKQDQSLSQQDRKAQMKALHQSEQSQIEAILTAEQKQKRETMRENHKGMGGERGPGGQGMIKMLTKELNLSQDQQAQMKTIFESGHQKMAAIHDNASLSEQNKHAQMKELHDSMHSQMNGILTPEQQQKFAEMLQNMHQLHKGAKDHSGAPDGQ